MHARKLLAGLATSAVALTAITLTAGPASAVYRPDPDDTTFTPVAADLVGVGSDTSQHVVKVLADAYNATVATGAPRVATYAATEGGKAQAADATIPLPSGDIKRPNGSGAGKGLLFGGAGGTGNADIDFARSSSAVSTAEAQAGLTAFPFALDTLGVAVSGNVPSNAPASLTVGDLVKIYKGEVTTWNQVGGTSTATIKALIPQSGSGTRTFFLAQLQAANGNVAIDPTSATVFQENDPTLIQDDPNAIAPFSVGLAGLQGTKLKVENGFRAQRALYNVIRQSDVSNPTVQAVFAAGGYFCSTAARSLIEASGFQQLATSANGGGVCGSPTQTATSNYNLNQRVLTTTTLAATAATANAYQLTATVTGGSPSGTVSFYQGETLLQSGVPLVQGQATYSSSTAIAPGTYTFTAQFVPDTGSAFDPSTSGPASATVKTGSAITETLPASVVAGNAAKGAVAVVLSNTDSKATGTVTIREGAKTLKTVALGATGAAAVALPVLAPGTHTLTAIYSGDAIGVASTKTFTVVVTKAKATLSETFPATVAPGKVAKGVVKVTLAGTPLKAGGSVKIRDGAKLLKSVTLANGQKFVTLPKLSPGKHFLKLVYAGTATAGAATKSFVVTQKKPKN